MDYRSKANAAMLGWLKSYAWRPDGNMSPKFNTYKRRKRKKISKKL